MWFVLVSPKGTNTFPLCDKFNIGKYFSMEQDKIFYIRPNTVDREKISNLMAFKNFCSPKELLRR